MINCFKRCQSKFGSVLIVVVCVFVVLIVFLASFMRSATSRTHSTKKIGDTLLARELANSLAITSFHYIKTVELKNEGSSLRKLLSSPMPLSCSSVEKGDLIAGIKANMKDGTGNVIDALLKNSGLNDIKLNELNWQFHKADFEILKLGKNNSPYLREKKGTIKISVKLSYKLPGQKDPISEDYLFASPISVVANILPVLSKFNFYVKDAFGGRRPNGNELFLYFNKVQTTVNGKVKNGYTPWVFANGDTENLKEYKSYKDFIKNKKGLIYLGGGTNSEPIVLGIARGFKSSNGNNDDCYGEDFHFYKYSVSGYWKTYEVWSDTDGILSANIGIASDYDSWQKLLGDEDGGYRNLATNNSIFRLYGIDTAEKSPTLVLGYVNSMSCEARAYKGEFGQNKLYYFDDPSDFVNFTTLNVDDFGASIGYVMQSGKEKEDSKLLKAFALGYSKKFDFRDNNTEGLTNLYNIYKEKYSSKIIRTRYNKDFTYFYAKMNYSTDSYAQAYPLENNIFDDSLKDLCDINSSSSLFTKIPTCDVAQYDKIYNTDELDKLDILFDKDTLFINGSEDSSNNERLSLKIEYSEKENETLNDYFNIKSILYKGSSDKQVFDPNGWIYIESSISPVKIGEYNSISQGGFIVAGKDGTQCNVQIDGNLTGEHLTIIALDGDIVVGSGVTKINASLIAPKGQLKLENNQELSITGNIVMKELKESNIEDSFKHKLSLTYKEELSAWPNNKDTSNEQRSELPLLMFDLKEKIVMLD